MGGGIQKQLNTDPKGCAKVCKAQQRHDVITELCDVRGLFLAPALDPVLVIVIVIVRAVVIVTAS